MQHFLQTQASVMLAYLGSSSLPGLAAGALPPLLAAAELPPVVHPQPTAGVNGFNAPADVAVSTPVTSPDELPPDRDALAERLLALVSERTGYPVEMLSLDADLEADLGIDSIKRVEIAGTMLRSVKWPAGSPPDTEQLTASRSLRQVLDQLQKLLDTVGAASPTTEEAGRPFEVALGEALADLERLIPRPVAAPAATSSAGLADGTIVLVDDGAGIGERVTELLQVVPRQVVRLAPEQLENLGQPQAVQRLVDDLRVGHSPLVGLIHLAALRPGTPDVLADTPAWRARLTTDLFSLFLLSQALQPDLERAAASGGAAVLAATGFGGAFATEWPGEPLFAAHGALPGMLKSLAQEWPAVRVKAVDVDPAARSTVAGQIVAELLTADDLVEVGYVGGRRVRIDLLPSATSATASAANPPLDRDAVLLITGGARGITAQAALHLAERYQPTLVLVGRTSLPTGAEAVETAGIDEPRSLKRLIADEQRRAGESPSPASVESTYRRLLREREIRDNLGRLRDTGARVDYRVCDVRDGAAVGALVDDVYAHYGRIDGVIHGAGVIHDQLVRDKRLNTFESVLATKVDGALALATRLRPAGLRFLVFFSSVAARFGNRGQADYAAANEVLNKLAQDLDRRWPGRVVSINWGPWLSGGMISPEVQRQFTYRGIELIPPAAGCRSLDREICSTRKGEAEVVIGARRVPSAAVAVADPPRREFPLLGPDVELVRHADGSGELLHTLDVGRDPYLNDHRLDGRPVLPFAMALELMAEAAGLGWPQLEVTTVSEQRVL
ncbi:MAG TPA: SDR family NAD(P)-dependent oxidoreductase, partial [Chloroflexota bacterium]